MNETWLRIKGRIGASKSVVILVGVFILILGFDSIDNAIKAITNLSGVQNVSVSQLAGNEIGANHYVTVSGIAAYDLSYKETKNGVDVAIVFPLVDKDTHTLAFVHSKLTGLLSQPNQQVTVTGITETTPTELQTVIAQDLVAINGAGYQASKELYILQDEKPGDPILSLLLVGGLGFVIAVCAATLFFPSTVFQAQPILTTAQPSAGPDRVTASGLFSQLKSISPTFEFGLGKQKFNNSIANILMLQEKWLALYIHFVQIYKVYGIPVSRRASDWAVVIQPTDVVMIEPGKLYGWRDRWAVSIRYRLPSGKEETVIVGFDNAGAQVKFVNFLREKNYPIPFQYGAVAPAWT
jgi:hypothetical protein